MKHCRDAQDSSLGIAGRVPVLAVADARVEAGGCLGGVQVCSGGAAAGHQSQVWVLSMVVRMVVRGAP